MRVAERSHCQVAPMPPNRRQGLALGAAVLQIRHLVVGYAPSMKSRVHHFWDGLIEQFGWVQFQAFNPQINDYHAIIETHAGTEMAASAGQMLLDGERTSGQDVRTANVTAAMAIANIVKSSLGPVGLDKMLVRGVAWRGVRAWGRAVGRSIDGPTDWLPACASLPASWSLARAGSIDRLPLYLPACSK